MEPAGGPVRVDQFESPIEDHDDVFDLFHEAAHALESGDVGQRTRAHAQFVHAPKERLAAPERRRLQAHLGEQGGVSGVTARCPVLHHVHTAVGTVRHAARVRDLDLFARSATAQQRLDRSGPKGTLASVGGKPGFVRPDDVRVAVDL